MGASVSKVAVQGKGSREHSALAERNGPPHASRALGGSEDGHAPPAPPAPGARAPGPGAVAIGEDAAPGSGRVAPETADARPPPPPLAEAVAGGSIAAREPPTVSPSLFKSVSDQVAAAAVAAAAGGAHRPDLIGPPRPPCDPERLVELHRLMGAPAAPSTTTIATTTSSPRDALAPTPGDARTPQVDHIVTLLCRLLGSEDAMLALLDGKRVFIRDAEGRTFKPGEFPWRCSFCGWSLASPTPQALIVPDARKDARFAANPFVVGPPGIRFYAGAPVISRAGHRLGTLCIADTTPRVVSSADVATLATLADLVAVELERDAAAAVSSARAEGRLRAASAAVAAVAATPSAASSASAALPPPPAPVGGTLLVDAGSGNTDPSTWTVLHVSGGAAEALGPPGAAARVATGGGKDGAPPPLSAPPVRLFGDLLRPPAAPAALASLAALGDRAFLVRDCAPLDVGGEAAVFDVAFRPAARGPPAGLGGEVGVPPKAASCGAGGDPTTPGIFTVSLTRRAAMVETPRSASASLAGPAALSLLAAPSLSSCLDPVAPAAPIPGLTLGVLVGKGSHGRVFRGTLAGEAVAVKVVSDAVRGLRRTGDGTPMECVLGAGLAHPCLVKTRAFARVRGGGGGGSSACGSDCGTGGSGGAWTAAPVTPPAGTGGAGEARPAATPPSPADTSPPPSFSSAGVSTAGSVDGLAGVEALPPAWPPPLPAIRTAAVAPAVALAVAPLPQQPTAAAAAAAAAAVAARAAARSPPPGAEGETWVVLEWCDLGTLQEAVDVGMFRTAPKPAAPPDARTVHACASDVASGLAALHAAGIAHGDLTAHNVLLASVPPAIAAREGRPGPWRAKLADLGLAAVVGQGSGGLATPPPPRGGDCEDGGDGAPPSSAVSAAAAAAAAAAATTPAPYGTITHQPPEVLARGGGPSRPADVYAYGVLLWTLAAGCRPWAGLTFAQVVAAVGLEGRRLRFEALPGPLPGWLVSLGEDCMNPVSSARPSMEAVVGRLAAVGAAEGWAPPGGGGV